MPTFPDDPRLTAFALGEVDPAEAVEIERLLAADPEARALVADIRATARLLSDHLHAEPAPGLAASHRRAIETHLKGASARPSRRRRRLFELAIAAGLLGLAATLLFSSRPAAPRSDPGRELARNDERLATSPPATPAPVVVAPPPSSKPAPVDPAEAAPGRPPTRSAFRGEPRDSARAPHIARGPGADPSPPTSESYGMFGAQLADNASTPPGPSGGPAGQAAPIAQAGAKAKLSANPARPMNRFSASRASSPLADRSGAPVPAAAMADVDRVIPLGVLAPKADREEARPSKDLPGRTGSRTMLAIVEAAGADKAKESRDGRFQVVSRDEPSPFPIECGTSSYSDVRNSLKGGVRPPGDAVRVEEMVNYFSYAEPEPRGDAPFAVAVEVAGCPWDLDHRLVRIGLKGSEGALDRRPACNLAFVIDVSGSIDDLEKLPLLKAGIRLLVESLGAADRVAIVDSANPESLDLDSTSCARKPEIFAALERLRPGGGGTDVGKGITRAYDIATTNLIPGGSNRVLLVTDGLSNPGGVEGLGLDRLVEAKRAIGVSLGVLGLGQGGVVPDRLTRLADRGDGRYFAVDSLKGARQVLVDQRGGPPIAIARDVDVQVRFNPDRAAAYRLIGFEGRQPRAGDPAADRPDGHTIGAGHSVTCLYEVVPPVQGGSALVAVGPPQSQAPRQQQQQPPAQAAPQRAGFVEVDIRCKTPDGTVGRRARYPADDDGRDFAAASGDFRFAAAVAGFGMLLRDSPEKGTLTWPGLIEMARGSIGPDPVGFRKEFLELVRKAQAAPSP